MCHFYLVFLQMRRFQYRCKKDLEDTPDWVTILTVDEDQRKRKCTPVDCITSKLKSVSKVLVHLAFFLNFFRKFNEISDFSFAMSSSGYKDNFIQSYSEIYLFFFWKMKMKISCFQMESLLAELNQICILVNYHPSTWTPINCS